MKPKTTLLIIILAVLGIIIIQNTEVAGFQLLFWKIEMSRAILFPLIFIAGCVIGYLTFLLKDKNK